MSLEKLLLLHYLSCNIFCGMAFLWNPFYSFFLGKNLFLSNLFLLSGHSVFVEIHFGSSSSWWHSQMYSVFLYLILFLILYILIQNLFASCRFLFSIHFSVGVIESSLFLSSVLLHASSISRSILLVSHLFHFVLLLSFPVKIYSLLHYHVC